MISDKEMILKFNICDALVLSFLPQNLIGNQYFTGFYIPENSIVEKSLGYSLQQICGEQKGIPNHYDNIGWPKIENPNKLEKRILEGLKKATQSSQENRSFFKLYLSNKSTKFEMNSVYNIGTTLTMYHIFRFCDGLREETIDIYNQFWTSEEKEQWEQIHTHMIDFFKKTT